MRISQAEGSFQFITGQLRDIQTFMHKKFGEHDKRFDKIDNRLDSMDQRFDLTDSKIDALPRIIAEMIADK